MPAQAAQQAGRLSACIWLAAALGVRWAVLAEAAAATPRPLGRSHQLLEHPFEDFSTTRNWALRVRAPQVISRVLVGNEYGQG